MASGNANNRPNKNQATTATTTTTTWNTITKLNRSNKMIETKMKWTEENVNMLNRKKEVGLLWATHRIHSNHNSNFMVSIRCTNNCHISDQTRPRTNRWTKCVENCCGSFSYHFTLINRFWRECLWNLHFRLMCTARISIYNTFFSRFSPLPTTLFHIRFARISLYI